MHSVRPARWSVPPSAETGRRHRHSRPATIEGAGSFWHFHGIVLLAVHRRHISSDCRTRCSSGRRHGRNGYAGDAVCIRIPGRIRSTTAVISAVVSVGSFIAGHPIAVRVRGVDITCTAVARGGAATHSGNTHHSFPRDILNCTGRSRAHSRGLKDRVLFRRIGTCDGRWTAGRTLTGRHRIGGYVMGCHMMTFLLRGLEL